MQPTASFTFLVITAKAESSAMDSRRGFASKLSPTQTALNAPESSPRLRHVERLGNRDRANDHAAVGQS